LRSRRERLTPRAVGLPELGRRRTPGLRREEVAQLAGVSVAWYTWLEQRRAIHPSDDALAAIANALRLGGDERAHLYALAGRPQPKLVAPPPPKQLTAATQAILDATAMPAYASDRAWNIIGCNALADALFGYSTKPIADRNSLIIAFFDPQFRAALVNWHDEAAQLVANLRIAVDEAPDDAALESIVERLRVLPEFRKLWARHDVARRHSAHKVLRHPRHGELVFDTQSFASALGVRVVFFVPDAATAKRLKKLA
jgi:transcriptional regulator with XRE-family HTH domain